MFAVHVRLTDAAAVITRMQTMREWLDHRRFEPTAFRYSCDPDGAVISVNFSINTEAAEFASTFDGHLMVHWCRHDGHG